MSEKRKGILKLVILAVLLAGAQILLKEDGKVFAIWWLAVLLLGWCSFPLCQYLFSGFRDKGYLVAKIFGIAGAGFLMWLGAATGIMPFTAGSCLGSVAVFAVICWGVWITFNKKKNKDRKFWQFTGKWYQTALDDELVFTLLFLLWTYVAGFRPAAYGTEKFMDYGFMMAMMRSTTLPAKDLWYAGSKINYYYGGQYFAVFLTKLTHTQVAQTYNLMRTLVAGFCFAVPFGLVRQMVLDSWKKEKPALLGGVLAGAGVSLAGNMHYVVIGKLLPWIREIFHLPKGDYTYWFPNSTRYIGYYPAENDKTIHEFPSYSFVLGDLHAHVVNLMFVVALISLVYAMMKHHSSKGALQAEAAGEKNFCKKQVAAALTDPYVLVFAFLIGMFHWTNYWDFVIYYVMGGMGVICCNYQKYKELEKPHRMRMTAGISLLHAVWVFLLATIAALPFTLQFQSMVSEVALAQNHSRPYQWWLIWGLPVIGAVLFFWCVKREGAKKADLFGVLLGISALGLIVIPEIVYVRDIYEKEYARSNTMFKLTYQAFTMFGILLGYALIRLWMEKKHVIRKVLTSAVFACFVGCCFYTTTAVHAWFGQVWDPSQYQGLDATAYLETTFPEDAAAIRWLNDNVTGDPVVLEANGDSYSDYERVSAMTGLPTVLGWYVHEWLWRGDTGALNERAQEVETIYTSTNQEEVKALLEKYQVEYIFVGAREREKYESLNESMLQSLGNVVFSDEQSQTYVLQVAFSGQ
mgnify:FL=1